MYERNLEMYHRFHSLLVRQYVTLLKHKNTQYNIDLYQLGVYEELLWRHKTHTTNSSYSAINSEFSSIVQVMIAEIWQFH